MSSYPNIFAATNCSLISGLIPPGVKKFVTAFMDGGLLRNPLGFITKAFGKQIGDLLGRLENFENLSEDLTKLNNALNKFNDTLTRYKRHTDILSGVIRDPEEAYATLDQIIGVMSAYNTMKDVLKDPGARLEDNFSQAFGSLNPRIVGPFFENFSGNMNEVERLLNEVNYQISTPIDPFTNEPAVDANGNVVTQKTLIAAADTLNKIGALAGTIGRSADVVQGFIDKDRAFYIAAAAALADYALANGLVASILSDPCFGGQVVMNLITTPDARQDLQDIATANGINIQNNPVDFSQIKASIEYDRDPLTELNPIIIPPPPTEP